MQKMTFQVAAFLVLITLSACACTFGTKVCLMPNEYYTSGLYAHQFFPKKN